MAIDSELYTDGIYQIHLIENMIRLDFMRLQPNPEGKTPVPRPTERIIMNPQGFIRTYEAMGQIVAKLQELGVIRPNDAPDAPAK